MKCLIASFLFLFLFSFSSIDNNKAQLTHAKSYIVVGDYPVNLTNNDRQARIWFITSDADSFEEFAQTAILAALELQEEHNNFDLLQVILVPSKDLAGAVPYYASVHYAIDGNGLKWISGADQKIMISFEWLVRAAEHPLSKLELEIANLWYNYQAEFPSENMVSSLSYNKEKLVSFIADSLKLDHEIVRLPQLQLLDYKDLDFLN